MKLIKIDGNNKVCYPFWFIFPYGLLLTKNVANTPGVASRYQIIFLLKIYSINGIALSNRLVEITFLFHITFCEF